MGHRLIVVQLGGYGMLRSVRVALPLYQPEVISKTQQDRRMGPTIRPVPSTANLSDLATAMVISRGIDDEQSSSSLMSRLVC